MTIDRLFISHQYIRGKGIEIGAWHNPFPLNPQMQVTYVDRYPYEELIKMRDNDPAIQGKAISRVDVVDDGMWLKKFENESQDFVLSSHQLEHCWSPIAAIRSHFRVLKPGGLIFYAIPDKRFTFDRTRETSEISDLVDDTDEETYLKVDLAERYVDYLVGVDKKSYDDASAIADTLDLEALKKLDIHWFCWTALSLAEMFSTILHVEDFDIELFSRAGHENFVVLRKL